MLFKVNDSMSGPVSKHALMDKRQRFEMRQEPVIGLWRALL
jgi:hypothetical protein